MNITDVDDKTIKNSKEHDIGLKEYTEKYTKAFFEDIEKLNIEKADIYPRATDHIDDMVIAIKKLMKKGYAYKGEDNSIYYSIAKFNDYGKLAQLRVDELKEGARVKQDEYDKEHAQDFALWKAYSEEDGNVFWETDLGKGRPGWHIECSVMSSKYLGETFDIHTGGVDLIFPHHQNEIAQAEAVSGKKFVNFWLHNEHLLVENKKMSKSLGNFFTLRDLLAKGYDPKSIRYLLLSTNYRAKLNFTFKGLEAAKNTLQRFYDFLDKLKEVKREGDGTDKVEMLIEQIKIKFEKEMDDDLNIVNALQNIFDFMTKVNKIMNKLNKRDAEKIYNQMMEFNKVLGVLEHEKGILEKEVEELIKKREDARAKKDYMSADKIRNELKQKGIILEDTKHGVRWKRV